MTEIRRQDGTIFIGGGYRETLSLKNAALLRTEINFLRETQGHFARFFRKNHEQAEAIFSNHQGYLLGECAWNHFNKPHNLIYCERLPNTDKALLVVVRSGSVFFDNEVDLSNITHELSTAIAPGLKYEVYLYGDVPIAEEAREGWFQLMPELVTQLTRLEVSAFAAFLTIELCYLLPVTEAMRIARLGGRFKQFIMIPVIGIVCVVIVVWLVGMFKSPPPPPPVQAVVVVNPLQGYLDAMHSPAPTDLMMVAIADIQGLYGLTGWYPNSIQIKGNQETVNLTQQGGSVENLRQWATANHLTIVLGHRSAVLTETLTIPNRSAVPTLLPMLQDLAMLQDAYSRFPEVTMSFTQAQSQGTYQITPVQVSFNAMTTSALSLQARLLLGFPAMVLDTFTVNINQGILSGNISLKFYGK